MLRLLIAALGCFSTRFLIYYTTKKALTPKRFTNFFIIACSALFTIVHLPTFYSLEYRNLIPNASIRQMIHSMCFFVPYFLYALFSFRDSFKKKIQTISIVMVTTFICDIIANACMNVALPNIQITPDTTVNLTVGECTVIYLIIFVSYVLCSITIYTICNRMQVLADLKLLVYIVLFSLSSISLLAVFINSIYPIKLIKTIFVLCITTILIYSVIKLIEYYKKTEVYKEKISETMKLQSANAEHYKEVQEKVNEMRTIQHDFKNQILTLKYLMEEGSEQSLNIADSMIKSLEESIEKTRVPVYTENTLVNSAVSMKIAEAEKLGIKIKTDIIIPSTLDFIQDTELSSLIINLLSNSIEATAKLSDNKIITFKMAIVGNLLVIKTINKFDTVDQTQKGVFNTTKADKTNHGVGMMIINNIVKKYKGNDKIVAENNTFEHTISFEI